MKTESESLSPGSSSASLFTRVCSDPRVPQASQIVAATLGLAGPIAAGAMIGHARIGIVAALGGLALGGGGTGQTLRDRTRGLLYSVTAGSAAVLIGSAMAGHTMFETFGIPALAAVTALFGSISRPLAMATTQFIIYLIIAANLGAPETRPLVLAFLFFLGAVWTTALSLGLKPLFRALRRGSAAPPKAAQRPRYPAKLLLRRWWKSLAHLSGWQYVIRITLCLAAAGAFEWIWPHHHAYWVSITVVIVVRRNLQDALSRTFHRAAGTALGVLFISLLLLGSPPLWATIAIIAALAAARLILYEVNYTAYATVMTPLVILLLDFGQEPSWAAIVDRLGATLFGCALGLTLGYLMWFRITPPASVTVRNKGNLATVADKNS